MRPVNAAAQLLDRHLCNAACAATAAQSAEMKGSTSVQTGRKEAAKMFNDKRISGTPRTPLGGFAPCTPLTAENVYRKYNNPRIPSGWLTPPAPPILPLLRGLRVALFACGSPHAPGRGLCVTALVVHRFCRQCAGYRQRHAFRAVQTNPVRDGQHALAH